MNLRGHTYSDSDSLIESPDKPLTTLQAYKIKYVSLRKHKIAKNIKIDSTLYNSGQIGRSHIVELD